MLRGYECYECGSFRLGRLLQQRAMEDSIPPPFFLGCWTGTVRVFSAHLFPDLLGSIASL
jgi:hypothetical protein